MEPKFDPVMVIDDPDDTVVGLILVIVGLLSESTVIMNGLEETPLAAGLTTTLYGPDGASELKVKVILLSVQVVQELAYLLYVISELPYLADDID